MKHYKATKSEESITLYEELEKRGYSTRFCELISNELNTSWTAARMLGYIRYVPNLREEDIVDEMLGILEQREMIRQKKELEYAQGQINELYARGLDSDD